MADTWKLTIYRGGVKHADTTLDSGKAYLAGRDPNCDIVLPSSIVSREHTKLTVNADGIVVEDNNSSNGTYIDGKRIASQKVNGVSPIGVGEYKLELSSNQSLRSIWQERLNSFLNICGNHPYKFSTFLILALVLLSVWFLQGPYENYVREIQNEATTNHAMLVAQSVLALNEDYWLKGIISNFKVTPLDSQEGIEKIYVVNQYAGVLAPQSHAYDVLDDVELERVLTPPGKEVLIFDDEGKGKIYLPVRRNDTVLGAVIVHYAAQQGQNLIPFGKYGAIILFLLLLALLLAYLLVNMFLRPWRQLADEADLSVGEEKNLFKREPGYKELQQHRVLYERLLLKAQTNGDDTLQTTHNNECSADIGKASVVNMPLSRKPSTSMGDCSCIIDRLSHHINNGSSEFMRLFGLDQPKAIHILDAFKNHESILAAVTKLLENNEGEHTATVHNRIFNIKTEYVDDALLKIVFQRIKHAS